MGVTAGKFRGLKEGEPFRLKLTEGQRKELLEQTGISAEYLLVNSMRPPGQVVHIQGHLADDAVID